MNLKKIVCIIISMVLLTYLRFTEAATVDVNVVSFDDVGETYTIYAYQFTSDDMYISSENEFKEVTVEDPTVAKAVISSDSKSMTITALGNGVTKIQITVIEPYQYNDWQEGLVQGVLEADETYTIQVGNIDSVSQLPKTFTVSDSFKNSAWDQAKDKAAEELAAIGLTPATTGLETSWRNYDEKEYKGEKQQAHERTVVIYCKDTSGNTRKVQLFFTYYDNANEGEAKLTDLGTVSGEERDETVFTNDVLEDISQYAPGDLDATSSDKIESMTSRILTVISNIGIAISVIMLAILGVKYMLGSVEEKAEYKEGLVPYVVGAFILFGITSFMKILIGIGNSLNGI